MDPKIPKKLKVYIKKARASAKKENKIASPYQKQISKQNQIVIINQGSKSKQRGKSRKPPERVVGSAMPIYPSIIYQQIPQYQQSYPNQFENRQQPINMLNRPAQAPLMSSAPYNGGVIQESVSPLTTEGLGVSPNPISPRPNPVLPDIVLQPVEINPPITVMGEAVSPRTPGFYDTNLPPVSAVPFSSPLVENAERNILDQQVTLEKEAYDDFGGYDAHSPREAFSWFSVPGKVLGVLSSAFAPSPFAETLASRSDIQDLSTKNVIPKPPVSEVEPLPSPPPPLPEIPIDFIPPPEPSLSERARSIASRGGGGGGYSPQGISDKAKTYVYNLALLQNKTKEEMTPAQLTAYDEAFKYIQKHQSPELLDFLEKTVTDMEFKTALLTPLQLKPESQPIESQTLSESGSQSLSGPKKLSDKGKAYMETIMDLEFVPDEKLVQSDAVNKKAAYAYFKKYPQMLPLIEASISKEEYKKIQKMIEDKPKKK